MSHWIAMHCSEELDELQARHPKAMLLLIQIVRRARWKRDRCPVTGLKFGEARVGDYARAGLESEKSYRCAQKVLTGAGLVKFEGRPRGTIATLIDQRFFSLSSEERGELDNPSGADSGRTRGELGAGKAPGHRDTETPGYEKASSSNIESLPEEVAYWNTFEALPKVREMNPQRKRKLAAIRKSASWRSDWRTAIEKLAASSFATGKSGGGWKAPFDFILRPDKLTLTLEGTYDDRPPSPNGSPNQPRQLDLSNNRRAQTATQQP